MFSDNIFKNKYLKYKTKYINLQKGGSAAAAKSDEESFEVDPEPTTTSGFGSSNNLSQ